MKDLLFLLYDGRIRAFGHGGGPVAPQVLRYQGKEDMPYDRPAQIGEFLGYMVANYGEGGLTRLSCVCLEPAAVADCARAATDLARGTPLALFSLEWLLPTFCRKLDRQADHTVTFAGRTWNVSGGTVEKADAHAACPIRLKEGDVAELFFSPWPDVTAVEPGAPAPGVAAGELARFVDRSLVEPKSSSRGQRRG